MNIEYVLYNHKKERLKKFKLDPKYEHKRSSGMTRRNNAGTKYQHISKNK